MFYVSGGKIYQTEMDSKLKVYREVKLSKDSEGFVKFTVTAGGSAKKPPNREVCTIEEVIAQLGYTTVDSGSSKQ